MKAHALAAMLFLASPVASHEFWIDPQIDGNLLTANLRVGEDFLGDALSYLPKVVDEMRHITPDGRSEQVSARIGDMPAIDGIAAELSGTHIFSVETNPAYIVFDDMPEFADYLAYEGWSDIVDAHRDRALPEIDIGEEYLRHSKALIQVGEGQITDRETGLLFELLLDPIAPEQMGVTVLLLWHGEPAKDVQLSLFHRADGETTRFLARTDAAGRATLPTGKSGKYLLNAVMIEAADGPGSVVWRSHWASTTFLRP